MPNTLGCEAACLGTTRELDPFIANDDLAEQHIPQPPSPKSQFRIAMERETAQGLGKIVGQSMGGGGPLVAVFLTAVTGGIWLGWELILLTPSLLTETIIDGVLVPARPDLARRIASEPWHRNMACSTFPYFAFAGLLAIVAGTFLPPVELFQ